MLSKNKKITCLYSAPGLPLTTTKKNAHKDGKNKQDTYFHTLPPAFWSNTHIHAYSWRVWVWDPSLVHSSSAALWRGTWDLKPVNFFLSDFFFLDFFLGIGPCGLVQPPPLEVEFHSLVTAVLITPKGTESPGSRRIGVIGALVLILPSETV
jgi:hypothetical protein